MRWEWWQEATKEVEDREEEVTEAKEAEARAIEEAWIEAQVTTRINREAEAKEEEGRTSLNFGDIGILYLSDYVLISYG